MVMNISIPRTKIRNEKNMFSPPFCVFIPNLTMLLLEGLVVQGIKKKKKIKTVQIFQVFLKKTSLVVYLSKDFKSQSRAHITSEQDSRMKLRDWDSTILVSEPLPFSNCMKSWPSQLVVYESEVLLHHLKKKNPQHFHCLCGMSFVCVCVCV